MPLLVEPDPIILGGSGGIGQAFIHTLLERGVTRVDATYTRHRPDDADSRVIWHQVDVRDESAVENLCDQLDNEDYQPEKSNRQINPGCLQAHSCRDWKVLVVQRCNLALVKTNDESR